MEQMVVNARLITLYFACSIAKEFFSKFEYAFS